MTKFGTRSFWGEFVGLTFQTFCEEEPLSKISKKSKNKTKKNAEQLTTAI